jgi:copper chaperone CopZ
MKVIKMKKIMKVMIINKSNFNKSFIRKFKNMKSTILRNSIFSFLVVIFSLTAGLSQTGAKTEKAVIKTSIACSHCQQCGSCGKMLNKNLKATAGVKKFTLDDKAETFTIVYDPAVTDIKKLRTAVSKLGFDADGVKADPTAYDKLDECCKK